MLGRKLLSNFMSSKSIINTLNIHIMKITNQLLKRKLENQIDIDQALMNEILKISKSKPTKENLVKYFENVRWEMEEKQEKLQAEYVGALKYLLPNAISDIEKEYDYNYFHTIQNILESLPLLSSDDIEVKDGKAVFTDSYRERILGSTTKELSKEEEELYSRLMGLYEAYKPLEAEYGKGLLREFFATNAPEDYLFNLMNRR